MNQETILFDAGMNKFETNIIKCIQGPHLLDNKQYMNLFTLIMKMSTQQSPHNYSVRIYAEIKVLIIKCVKIKLDELNIYFNRFDIDIRNKYKHYLLLKTIHYSIRIISKCSSYLDRFHTKRNNLPCISQALCTEFNNSIYKNIYYGNNDYLDSRDTHDEVIHDIENEWLKLIKAQQYLSLVKFNLPDDIINIIRKYMVENPPNTTIFKILGLKYIKGKIIYPLSVKEQNIKSLKLKAELKYQKDISTLQEKYSIKQYKIDEKNIYDRYQSEIRNITE